MNLGYSCPECGEDLRGGFGDDVHCEKCNKTYETDWDYCGEDYDICCWIVGEKQKEEE